MGAYNRVWIRPARPAHHAATPDRAHEPVTAGGLERRHRGRAVAPAAIGAGPCAHDTGTRSLPAGAIQLRFFHRQPALMQGMYAGVARRIFE